MCPHLLGGHLLITRSISNLFLLAPPDNSLDILICGSRVINKPSVVMVSYLASEKSAVEVFHVSSECRQIDGMDDKDIRNMQMGERIDNRYQGY